MTFEFSVTYEADVGFVKIESFLLENLAVSMPNPRQAAALDRAN